MILKISDNKEREVAELERLMKIAPASIKSKVEQELRAVRAGIKGEQESAYLIDFDFKTAKNTLVIHDLRLEVNGRVAQIDHLLLHRTMNIFVLESKHLHAGMQITEEGEFKQWNDYAKRFEGMASPLAQNERHIAVLKDAFDRLTMPTRAGFTLAPTFHSYVLVSPKARIDRPKKFDSRQVIKADMLLKTIEEQFEKFGVMDTFANLARFVSIDTVAEIGKQLIKRHRPMVVDYAAKFGITEDTAKTAAPAEKETVMESPSPQYAAASAVCQECGGEVDKKVVYFCRINKAKFGGKIYCRECQKIPAAEIV